MDLLEENILFGTYTRELFLKDLLKEFRQGNLILHHKQKKEISIDSSIYKLLNHLPINIICLKDYQHLEKFHVLKGYDDLINIINFVGNNFPVKINNKTILFKEMNPEAKKYFLEVLSCCITNIVINESVNKERFNDIAKEILKII